MWSNIFEAFRRMWRNDAESNFNDLWYPLCECVWIHDLTIGWMRAVNCLDNCWLNGRRAETTVSLFSSCLLTTSTSSHRFACITEYCMKHQANYHCTTNVTSPADNNWISSWLKYCCWFLRARKSVFPLLLHLVFCYLDFECFGWFFFAPNVFTLQMLRKIKQMDKKHEQCSRKLIAFT